MNDNGNGNGVSFGKTTIVAIIGVLLGLLGSVIYVGASLRQVEVNSNRISEIEQHGSGILQALKLQVQNQEVELNNIRRDFRTRDFWETLERRLSSLEVQARMNPGSNSRIPQDPMPRPPER